jgi:adenylate kinase family enzyme
VKLIVLVGPPGSGKSTYRADDLVFKNVVVISQDEQGRSGHMDLFKRSLDNEFGIVIDRMNFNKQQRDRYVKPAREAGYEIEIIVFHVSRQICFERIMARENHPTINGIDPEYGGGRAGIIFSEEEELKYQLEEKKILKHKEKQANSALDTFFTKYERVEDTEADKVTRLGWDGPKKKAVGFDIDGTMANIDHRLHYVRNEFKKLNRWDLFFKEIPKDTVNEWCKSIASRFSHTHSIIYCSGRPDSTRKDTEIWLKENKLYYSDLFMRNRNDFREDSIVKEIIYEFEIKTKYDLLFVVDDRTQVVQGCWRKHKVICLQCADGNF